MAELHDETDLHFGVTNDRQFRRASIFRTVFAAIVRWPRPA
jgi:hypothetical protein